MTVFAECTVVDTSTRKVRTTTVLSAPVTGAFTQTSAGRFGAHTGVNLDPV
jgi:hypothetical protein